MDLRRPTGPAAGHRHRDRNQAFPSKPPLLPTTGKRMSKTTCDQTDKTRVETPIELQEMARAIETLPARYRDAIAPSLQRVIECSTRRRRILTLVQEALAQLRLDMKYLIFDLEATRRERDEYREKLEQRGEL